MNFDLPARPRSRALARPPLLGALRPSFPLRIVALATAAWLSLGADAARAATPNPVVLSDQAPVVTAPASYGGVETQFLQIQVSVADPDGDPIDSLRVELTGFPAGASVTFTPAPGNGSGTLTWTPGYADGGGPYGVTFIATNALTGTSSTWITVDDRDREPIVTTIESVTTQEGMPVSVEVSVTDPDGDPIESLVADLGDLPPGHQATFTPNADNTGGTFAWTPQTGDGGHEFFLRFTAENNLSAWNYTWVIVDFADQLPVVTAPSIATVDEGGRLTIHVTAVDPDEEPITSLSADLSSLPPGTDATFEPDPDQASGTLTWNPGFDDAGDYVVTFSAENRGIGTTATEVTVYQVDRAPVVTVIDSVTVNHDETLSLNIVASDADGDPIDALTADLSGLPAGNDAIFVAAADRSGGTLEWTPDSLQAGGPYAITFQASNALESTATTRVRVVVLDHRPVVTAPGRVTAEENQPISFDVVVTDLDAEPIERLAADLSRLPPDARFVVGPDHLSGVLTWTPGYHDGGATYPVSFTASNRDSGSATTTIEVANVDRSPFVTAPDSVIATTSAPVTIAVTAGDPDADPLEALTVDRSRLPAGNNSTFTVSADRASGTFTWTPSQADSGAHEVTFLVDNEMSAFATTRIVVRSRNRPPVAALAVSPRVTSTPMKVTADASASSDPDGPIASYRFDFGNGVVIGPQASPIASATYAEAGVYTVIVTVTDPFGVQDTAAVIVQTDLGNLIVNSGLENTPIGWTSYGSATIVRVKGTGRTGDYSFSATKPTGSAWGLNDNPDSVPLTAGVGRTYRVIAWVRSPSATGSAYLRVQEFLGLIGKGTVNSPRVTLSPNWQMLSADLTIKAAGTRLDIKVLDDPVAADEKFYVDDVQILLLPKGDQAPVVMVPRVVTAIAGQPLTLSVRAADADGQPVTSLTAGLATLPPGHGASFTSNAAHDAGTFTWTPSAAHVSPVPYVVGFTAANGLSTTIPVEIIVADAPLPNLCANPDFETSTAGWAPYVLGAALQRVNSSRTGVFAVQLTDSSGTGWGLNDEPDIVPNAPTAGRTYRYSAWVRSTNGAGKVRMRVQEFLGTTQKGTTVESPELTLTPSWQRLAMSYTVAVAGTRLDLKIVDAPSMQGENFLVDGVEVRLMPVGDRPPVMAGPAPITAVKNQPITLSVTVADPDGDAITELAADLSGLPAGHGAVFTPGPGNTTGILSWTPGATAVRAAPYTVTFTATNTRVAILTATIAVVDSAPPNLVANPGFEVNTGGWGTYGAVTLARVAGGHSGGFGLGMTGRLVSMFGCDDSPNWVATVPAAGARYRFGAWMRSTTTTSPARLRIYEFVNGVQIGPVIYSQEIPLSPTWQYVTTDYVALQAGSTLSLRVVLVPAVLGETFVLDDVSIQALSGGASLLAGGVGFEGATATPVPGGPRAMMDVGPLDLAGDDAWTLRLEGIEPLLENGVPTIALRLPAGEVAADPDPVSLGEDSDANGREELAVTFPRSALRGLLRESEGGTVDAIVIARRDPGIAVEIPVRIELAAPPLAFTSSFFPNPMRSEGTLSFTLTRPGPVRIDLFDLAGRRARTLLDERRAEAGPHRLAVSSRSGGTRLASGVYFYRIAAGEGARAGRVVIVE